MNLYIFIIGLIGVVSLAFAMLLESKMNACAQKLPTNLRQMNSVFLIISTAIVVASFSTFLCHQRGDFVGPRTKPISNRVLDIIVLVLGLVLLGLGIAMLSSLNKVAKDCDITLYPALVLVMGLLVSGIAGFNFSKETYLIKK